MVDDRLQNTPTLRRFRTARIVSFVCVIIFSASWLWLYYDSVGKRRNAESLIADLKSFPFATAGFRDVRDLTLRHDGSAIQQFPPLQFPHFGMPFTDSLGETGFPPIEGGPECTMQNCIFEIWVKSRLARLPLGPRAAELVYTTLPYIGIRSWIVYSRFQVTGGKLVESETTVGEIKRGRSGSYVGLIPFGYEVVSTVRLNSFDDRYNYTVGFPHVTGPPSDVLRARIVQIPDAPLSRAFDIHLQCLTAVLGGCRGFDELAPSAWADYNRRR